MLWPCRPDWCNAAQRTWWRKRILRLSIKNKPLNWINLVLNAGGPDPLQLLTSTETSPFPLSRETKRRSNLFLTPLTLFFSVHTTVLLSQISHQSLIFSPSLTYSQPLPPSFSSLLLPFLQSLPRKLLAIQFREAVGSIGLAAHTAAAGRAFFFIPAFLSVW